MLLGRLSTAVMRASSCAHPSAPLSAFEVSYANEHTNVLFYYSGQVRKIVLNFNSIEDRMSVDAWTNLGDVLEELYLGDCRLKELPAGMFDHMHQLRYLHLWKNQISVIPSKFFQVSTIYFIE